MESLDAFKQRKAGRPFTGQDAAKYLTERLQGRGFSKMGLAGAAAYLADYGHNISVGKVIRLAVTAEVHGLLELAQGFWDVAYTMEHGCPPESLAVSVSATATLPLDPAPTEDVAPLPFADPPVITEDRDPFGFLPDDLRPGNTWAMQPTDALHARQYYIDHADYCGQPKKDGWTVVIFATPDRVVYQNRRGEGGGLLREAPAVEIDRVLRWAATEFGSFVCVGELVYYSYKGSEHRTAPQAAQVNLQAGRGEDPVHPCICIFDGLYADHTDLRQLDFDGRAIWIGSIAAELASTFPAYFEWLKPVYGSIAKAKLAQQQQDAGHEGEIWRLCHAPFAKGKTAPGRAQYEPIVRTKYYVDRVVKVVRLAPTTATKVVRLFSAIVVADPVTNQNLGRVGTGFTMDDQVALKRAFEAAQSNGHNLLIEVTAAGYTETGQLWLPVFNKIVEGEHA